MHIRFKCFKCLMLSPWHQNTKFTSFKILENKIHIKFNLSFRNHRSESFKSRVSDMRHKFVILGYLLELWEALLRSFGAHLTKFSSILVSRIYDTIFSLLGFLVETWKMLLESFGVLSTKFISIFFIGRNGKILEFSVFDLRH